MGGATVLLKRTREFELRVIIAELHASLSLLWVECPILLHSVYIYISAWP